MYLRSTTGILRSTKLENTRSFFILSSYAFPVLRSSFITFTPAFAIAFDALSTFASDARSAFAFTFTPPRVPSSYHQSTLRLLPLKILRQLLLPRQELTVLHVRTEDFGDDEALHEFKTSIVSNR